MRARVPVFASIVLAAAGLAFASNMGFKLNAKALNALFKGSGIEVVVDNNTPQRTDSVGIVIEPADGVAYALELADDYGLRADRDGDGSVSVVVEPFANLTYSVDPDGTLEIMYGDTVITLVPQLDDPGYFWGWVDDEPITTAEPLTVTDNNVPAKTDP